MAPILSDTSTGDTDADDELWFRDLFRSSYPQLVAYARRRLSDPSDADDVVSEVFATAWRRRADRRDDAPGLPWLYGIAGNVVRNHRRSAGRHLRLVDKLEAQPRPQPPVGSDPGDGEAIRAALSGLSPDDQEVLRLVAWEGLSHAEVGEVLGVSTNAVGIRVHRARQRLQVQLEQPNPPAAGEPT